MSEGLKRRGVENTIKLYQKGVFTLREVADVIGMFITKENVSNVVSELPTDFVAHFRTAADTAPRTEAGWDELRIRSFQLGMYTPEYTPTAPEQIDAEAKQAALEYRRLIETLRVYFASQTF